MPATQLRVPWCLKAARYQSLSARIGPPTIGVTSHTDFSSLGDRSPCARSSSVKLLPCVALFAYPAKKEPRIVLPPSRGTKLIATPAVSASPRPPDVLMLVSCAMPTLTAYMERFAPCERAEPTVRPSTVRRPSPVRPP